jgi:hypothetical protein
MSEEKKTENGPKRGFWQLNLLARISPLALDSANFTV